VANDSRDGGGEGCADKTALASGGHATVALAAFARVVWRGFVSGDVSRLLILAHAFLAEAATAVIDAAYHPRLGGAGSKKREGEESDEPFHISEALVWLENAVVVKKNRSEVGDSLRFRGKLASGRRRC
jgi:hypothetical protein